MKKHAFITLAVAFFSCLNAQVTLDPVFATQHDSVTIIFDASKGSKGLMDLSSQEVYMHTGVITNKSNSPTDWQNVQGAWGTADAPRRMNYSGNNIYKKKIKIHDFYGLSSSDTVKRLAFVFRNKDGSKEGKTGSGGDIFVELAQAGLQVKFQSPSENPSVYLPSETISFDILASQNATLTLKENGKEIQTTTGTSLKYTAGTRNVGDYTFVAIAKSAGIEHRDTLDIVVRASSPNIATLPFSDLKDGVNYVDDTSVILLLHAPRKDFIYVQGDFNDWKLSNDYAMNLTPDRNTWWIQVNGLQKKSYAYIYNIDGKVKVADPMAELVLDPWNDAWVNRENFPKLPAYPTGKTNGIVSVFTLGKTAYPWKNSTFEIKNPSALNIYELHIRDFIASRDYETLIDTLNYIKSMGINAIELMPIGEFEGNNSWGYGPSFHMAVDKYYGNENQLKEFIDICHGEGIAVILDMVLNHAFGQSSHCRMYWDANNNRPSSDNPWLNPVAKHDFNVGCDYNHESSSTAKFVQQVLHHWLTEFQFDGFRFDLSKGFTQKNTLGNTGAWGQLDNSRVNIWKRIRDEIHQYDKNAVLILEHFADNNEEKILSKEGFLIWGKANHEYNEATMGYTSDLSWGSNYKSRGWSEPNLVSYMESHDEERLMYKNLQYGNSNGNYSAKDLNTGLKRVEMASNIFFTVPGPKMIWQFGELGYDYNIDYNGRTGEKPIKWDYLQDRNRAHLRWVFSTLMKLRNSYDVFNSDDFNAELYGVVKKTWIQKDDHKIHAISNTNVKEHSTTLYFQNSGIWYEVFSGDSIEVSNTSVDVTLKPGEYRLYSTVKMDIKPFQFKEQQNTISNSTNTKVQIFPNPADNYFNISVPNNHDVKLEIFSLTGKRVYLNRFVGNTNIGTEAFKAGTYFIRITGSDVCETQRLIIKN